MRVPAWHESGGDEIANAVAIPPRFVRAPDPPGPIPVTVRIVWQTADGGTEEQTIETVAGGWTRDAVWVRMDGPRYRLNYVWVHPRDVRRRGV